MSIIDYIGGFDAMLLKDNGLQISNPNALVIWAPIFPQIVNKIVS